MRNVMALCMLLVAFESLGQDSTRVLLSKKGLPILPEKGNWSVGLSTGPFLSYLGNMFNNTTFNSPPSFSSPGNLVVKYMRSATSAYRLNVGLNMNSLEGKFLVQNSTSNNPQLQVMDKKTYSSTFISLGFGLERRRGQGRLQGIYGLDVGVSLNSSQSTYTYGNALTLTNPVPWYTVWDDFSATPLFQGSGNSRTLKSSRGTQFSIGVGGFIGAEYFFAPKLSLGGELRILLRTAPGTSGSSTIEYIDTNNNTLNTVNKDLPSGSTKLQLSTITTGSLNLNIYF